MQEKYHAKEQLLKAGKEEFLEKGFEKASLRKICEKAGVTTGALYFFFENKEDLFCRIVADTIRQMENLAGELNRSELSGESGSAEADKKLIEFLWLNRSQIRLLLDKSEGTRYENFKSKIFEQMEKNFSLFFEKCSKLNEDRHLIRVLVEMRMRGYMELIYGDYSLREVMRLSEMIGCYADAGFAGLLKKYGNAPENGQMNHMEM